MKISLIIIGIIVIIAGIVLYTGSDDSGQATTETSAIANTSEAEADSVATNSSVAGTTEVPASCPDSFVVAQAEGPFYSAGTPERNNLVEADISGTPLTVTGSVFDSDCNPIAGAWLDFWQTDGEGDYDNVGYKLRGHQLTDENGAYVLQTVLPGEYPGRPPHIHLKIAPSQGDPVTTTQLYFPGVGSNSADSIFNDSLVVSYDANDPTVAYYNFKIDTTD